MEDANVEVRPPKSRKADAGLGGPLLDISSRGLRFISTKAHPPGSRLKVSIHFAGVNRVLECDGLIRWAHPHAPPEQFAIGVEFDELDEEGQKTLRQVRNHEKSKTRGPKTALRHKEALAGGLVPPPAPAARKPPPPPIRVAASSEEAEHRGSKLLNRIFIALLVVVVAGIAAAAILLNPGRENFHRFGKGSTWVYVVTSGGEPSLWTVEAVGNRGDGGISCRRTFLGEPTESDEFVIEEFDYLVKGNYLVRRSDQNRFYRVYRFGSAPGESWETRPGMSGDLKTVHQGTRSVTVPAGTFENAVSVRFMTFDRGEREETLTLVDGVGVVRREVVLKGEGTSTRRVDELKEYSLVPAGKN